MSGNPRDPSKEKAHFGVRTKTICKHSILHSYYVTSSVIGIDTGKVSSNTGEVVTTARHGVGLKARVQVATGLRWLDNGHLIVLVRMDGVLFRLAPFLEKPDLTGCTCL